MDFFVSFWKKHYSKSLIPSSQKPNLLVPNLNLVLLSKKFSPKLDFTEEVKMQSLRTLIKNLRKIESTFVDSILNRISREKSPSSLNSLNESWGALNFGTIEGPVSRALPWAIILDRIHFIILRVQTCRWFAPFSWLIWYLIRPFHHGYRIAMSDFGHSFPGQLLSR